MPLAAPALALARFALWIQTALFSTQFRFVRQIENCDAILNSCCCELS